MLAVINLAEKAFTVDIGPHDAQEGPPIEVFADSQYAPAGDDLRGLDVGPYGYRWIRLRRHRRVRDRPLSIRRVPHAGGYQRRGVPTDA
jgi:hypothetical protein